MSEVKDNPTRSRFEMASGGAVAFAGYWHRGDRIVLTHAEMPEVLPGRAGVGSKLIRGALDRLRADSLMVVPRCEFVAAYVERHPE